MKCNRNLSLYWNISGTSETGEEAQGEERLLALGAQENLLCLRQSGVLHSRSLEGLIQDES